MVGYLVIIWTRGWRCFTKHKPHAGHRKGWKIPFFVPGDLDLWPWYSSSSERGTKHVFQEFGTNLFSGISNTNKKVTDSAKRTLHSSLCVV